MVGVVLVDSVRELVAGHGGVPGCGSADVHVHTFWCDDAELSVAEAVGEAAARGLR